MARREMGPATVAVVAAVRNALPDAGPRAIRLGVSGGPDSMALAVGMARAVRDRDDLRVDALVVDHALQAGSDTVAATTVAALRRLGLAAASVRVDASGQGGPEAGARLARHHALWTTPLAADRSAHDPARLPDEVWLGHTLDDQAETVLLGLLRGSGARTLAGMAARRNEWDDEVGAKASSGARVGQVVRPLLGLRRELVRRVCEEAGVAVWLDPTNEDPRQPRAIVRHEVLPVLGDRAVLGLARSADLARADADLLDDLAARARTGVEDHGALDVNALAAQPAALAGRIVHSWLIDRGSAEPTSGHVAAVLALVHDWHGQGPVGVAGGVEVRRIRGTLLAHAGPGGSLLR